MKKAIFLLLLPFAACATRPSAPKGDLFNAHDLRPIVYRGAPVDEIVIEPRWLSDEDPVFIGSERILPPATAVPASSPTPMSSVATPRKKKDDGKPRRVLRLIVPLEPGWQFTELDLTGGGWCRKAIRTSSRSWFSVCVSRLNESQSPLLEAKARASYRRGIGQHLDQNGIQAPTGSEASFFWRGTVGGKLTRGVYLARALDESPGTLVEFDGHWLNDADEAAGHERVTRLIEGTVIRLDIE